MRKNWPGFIIYVDDYLTSSAIDLLSLQEAGARIRLLTICWKENGLPDDDKQLAVLSRLGEAWPSSSKKIREFFFLSKGKLQNKELQIQRKKQQIWLEKSRIGGLNSAKARQSKGLSQIKEGKGGLTTLTSKLQPQGNNNPIPNITIINNQNQQANAQGILTNSGKEKPPGVGVEKNFQDVLDLDCQIVQKRDWFLQEIQRIFFPVAKRTAQTFANITAFFVRQAQADSTKISYFTDAIEWAKTSRIDGIKSGGAALFVATIKQKTGYGSQPRLLAAKV